jgi:hypothetical protein
MEKIIKIALNPILKNIGWDGISEYKVEIISNSVKGVALVKIQNIKNVDDIEIEFENLRINEELNNSNIRNKLVKTIKEYMFNYINNNYVPISVEIPIIIKNKELYQDLSYIARKWLEVIKNEGLTGGKMLEVVELISSCVKIKDNKYVTTVPSSNLVTLEANNGVKELTTTSEIERRIKLLTNDFTSEKDVADIIEKISNLLKVEKDKLELDIKSFLEYIANISLLMDWGRTPELTSFVENGKKVKIYCYLKKEIIHDKGTDTVDISIDELVPYIVESLEKKLKYLIKDKG